LKARPPQQRIAPADKVMVPADELTAALMAISPLAEEAVKEMVFALVTAALTVNCPARGHGYRSKQNCSPARRPSDHCLCLLM